ncbi:type II toxin-antitoxin system PemK/MazF family toxin [Streptomyces sp. SP18CS02]|uniref:type II toxin-antitoxin system PemK/MazF family toxin n=1 Tax=Streptomyces sp. SP18CS02 TaxID=3002531 RepID=UPI002E79450B|nr:type II toxin-antitoxin system PemK/MazF family toxin [Streptomyces sp. SP18CS02]MEE1752301.1 type II toxin-antitoxin system PemK/MazF family toxin [Streptomyces sp. SP18CS02]
MDTSWWLALGAVVVLALVAAVADGVGRGARRTGGARRGARRPGGRTRPPARPSTRPSGRPAGPREAPEPRPRPGEIWWADVPYEDGPGSKDRPCLVLSVRGGTALVAKITSKYHDDRAAVIALRPGTVGDAGGRPSFLETDELRDVPVWEFRRRVGPVDPLVWDQVRHLAA